MPVLSAQQFQQFYKSIQKESFDSKKLERTKKLLAKYRLEGSQVAALAKLFAFDSNRLEWTKSAYSKVIDPFSYYEFDQVFEFQTTFKQLIDFIESL